MTREQFENAYPDATIFLDPDFEDALVGGTSDGRNVYDRAKMIQCLVDLDGMTHEEADEYISYNTERAMGYINVPPVIMDFFEKEE